MFSDRQIPGVLSPFVAPTYQRSPQPMQHLGVDEEGHVVMKHNADGGPDVTAVLAVNQPNPSDHYSQDVPHPDVAAQTAKTVTDANTKVTNTENVIITDLAKLAHTPKIEYFAIGGAIFGLIAGKVFHFPLIWSALLFSAGASFYAYHKNQ